MIEKQHEYTIKVVMIDNELEFLMSGLYAFTCIEHQTSCVEIPNKMGGLRANTNTY